MQVTIKDIASKLGLSPTTISRVLNGRESALVSEGTRQKVLQTALEMGYTPNRMARALVTGQTRSIALWVYAVHPSYYSSIINDVSQILRQDNYEVHVVEVGKDRSLVDICSWPVDGIIAFDCTDSVDSALEIDNLIQIPIVSLGATLETKTDCVSFDLAAGASAAMEHLLNTGRKDIAFLSGNTTIEDIRRNCYIKAMSDAGLASESISIETDSDPSNQARDAYNCMRKYLAKQKHPEAIFCYNDQTAIGAYKALLEAGLNIPDDVALVGCDGIDMSEYINPTLTTIVQPFEEMCLLAWQFLQNRINDSDIPRQETILKCRLEVRGSSRVNQHDTLMDTVQYSSASLK